MARGSDIAGDKVWAAAFGAALLILSSAALVGEAGAQAPTDKWGAHIDLEGKLGNNRDLGEADVFVPVWQDGISLLFGNIKARLDDNASREGNFGLGLRHMLESGWNLGTYGFFDRRRTETHNWFSQATFGIEALSLDWDLRANAYLPLGTRTHDLGGSAGGSSTAAVNGTTVTVTTPGSSIREERSLMGFDAEIGWRVPVFAAEGGTNLRVYGGAYRFYANEVNPVQGPRGRVELTFDELPFLWSGSRLALGGEVQHDGPRGTTGFASARLRIPLQIFGESAARLTPIERRMADPIVRDIDIVAQSRSSSTPSVVETATQVSGGQTLTVLDSGSTTGPNLPTAINAAGANTTILLSGTFNTTSTVTLLAGQTLRGGGSFTVQTPSGKTATLTTSTATISASTTGGTANPAIALANNATVTNLTVSHTGATGNGVIGIRGVNVTGITVSNNTITASETNAGNTRGIELTGTSAGTISGNTITATGNAGNLSSALTLSNSGSTTVSSNTLSASGGGGANDQYLTLNTANIASGSTGNSRGASGACQVNTGGTGTFAAFTNAGNCGP